MKSLARGNLFYVIKNLSLVKRVIDAIENLIDVK